jgi:glycine cleavage system aminomethyltransferase T
VNFRSERGQLSDLDHGPFILFNYDSDFGDLASLLDRENVRILHLIRDPRDVVISAMHYHKAARESVAVFDLTSFSKFLLQGRDAGSALQYLCANNLNIPIGGSAYTGLLNQRGNFESDLTVSRIGDDRFLIVTGTAQATRDVDSIRCSLLEGKQVHLTDVTSAYAVLAVMGPRSRELLSTITRAPLDNAAFPFGAVREIGIGPAAVIAARRTYVGELGWELYVPVELAAGVYDTLMQAGAPFGAKDAGYYAIDSLRLEKGYRAWGRELTPDNNPYEAGLSFAVDLDKGDFLGRAALIAAKDKPLSRRLLSFVGMRRLSGSGLALFATCLSSCLTLPAGGGQESISVPFMFEGNAQVWELQHSDGNQVQLVNEFVSALRDNRNPWPNATLSANWTTCVRTPGSARFSPRKREGDRLCPNQLKQPRKQDLIVTEESSESGSESSTEGMDWR